MKKCLVTSLALTLLLTVLGANAATQAGRAIFTWKKVVGLEGGKPRAVKRASPFYAGETIETGDNARAQLRYTDNTVVSIASNSEYKVDTYRYTGGANSQHASTLLNGTMRVVTGKISKTSTKAFTIATPVATIGLRGTAALLSYNSATRQTMLIISSGVGCVIGRGAATCVGPNLPYNTALVSPTGATTTTESSSSAAVTSTADGGGTTDIASYTTSVGPLTGTSTVAMNVTNLNGLAETGP